MMRATRLGAAVMAGCTLGSAAVAHAAAFTFDADGAAGANGAVVVGALDMAPGNTLLTAPTPTTYQLSHQASLVGLINASGTPIATAGLNSTFEITVVSNVRFDRPDPFEGGNLVLTPVQPASSFIEIWYDTTPDADSLAGTGYNDGTRIYFGSPTAAMDNLVSQNVLGGPNVPYDQFGVNNYPGEMTPITTGSYFFGSTTNLQDPSFFVTPVISVELTTGIDTPFDMTNPSANYVNAPGGVPSTPSFWALGGGAPYQADGALQFAVPEPGCAALFALALPLMLRRRVRRPSASA